MFLSTTKSSYKLNMAHFILKGTTIINTKLTMGFSCGYAGNLAFSIVLKDVVNLVRPLLMSYMTYEL